MDGFYIAAAGDAIATPSLTYTRDRWSAHTGAVEATGIEPPKEWTEQLGRYSDFIELGDHGVERLIAAVLSGQGDTAELRGLALVEQIARSGDDAAVAARVRDAVLHKLQETYAPVAERNFKTCAAAYNDVTGRFAATVKLVDVEGSGDGLLGATHAQRQAWLDAPDLAGQCEQRLRPLLAAASLLPNIPDDVAYLGGASDLATSGWQIALAADLKGVHRRRGWEAWATTSGRTGRWGPLVALGAKLRAGEPSKVTPYAEPAALVTVRTNGGRLTHHDPHDGPLPSHLQPVQAGWYGEKPNTAGVL